MSQNKTNNTKEINKPDIPFEVVLEDTESAIMAIINQSNLPTCIISNMLSNIAAQYNIISKKIANQKRDEYNRQLINYNNAMNENKQED